MAFFKLKNKNSALLRIFSFIIPILFFCILPIFITESFSNETQNVVHLITLNDDTINPATAEYISKSIDQSETENGECLIIQMDTPGGLLSSTRSIVKKILTSKIPVVVYIAPSGSRAGSAGVFITYSSHIAAMAPSTNIGAAHPVMMGKFPAKKNNDFDDIKDLFNELKKQNLSNLDLIDTKTSKMNSENKNQDVIPKETPISHNKELTNDPLQKKILNDTVAFIKSIAKERNRNIEWAIKSVTQSASITSKEAIDTQVVEIIAADIPDLLNKVHGRIVKIDGIEKTLNTKGAFVEEIRMNNRQKFFNVLADPNIAYLLLILGFLGLVFEVTHPGFGVPGILGALFLILAFYSLQTLPTNFAGLLLLVFGLFLLMAEAFVPGFGLFTLGGFISLILGSLLLFDSIDPMMRVAKPIIFTFSLLTTAFSIIIIKSLVKSIKSKITTGIEGLIGLDCKVTKRITPEEEGKVFVHGELWNATANIDIEKNSKVKIIQIEGMLLTVEKFHKINQV